MSIYTSQRSHLKPRSPHQLFLRAQQGKAWRVATTNRAIQFQARGLGWAANVGLKIVNHPEVYHKWVVNAASTIHNFVGLVLL